MKKVLVLSALGCVATVGAVFAAFTLDPTTETEDITVANIDVDLSAKVFSEFKPVTEFDYYEEADGGVKLLYTGVPVSNPAADLTTTKFKFKSKRTETGGGTLDLHCDNAYTYDNWIQYLDWRKSPEGKEPAEDDPSHAAWVVENLKRAPVGYAFKYTYDDDFLAKIAEDDVRPAMVTEDWQYPIFKTNFSSAITQSNFTAAGLSPFGIEYTDPDATNPNYNDFVWDKSGADPDWCYGNDAFFIKPDVVQDPDSGEVRHLNSGIMIFNGTEITENLFGGEYIDAEAMTKCAEYLNNKDPDHKQFKARIKATEYFRIHEHKLETDPNTGDAIYLFEAEDEEELRQNHRYSFDMTVTDETAALLNDGYQLAGFGVLGQNGTADVVPLLYDGRSTISDLLLKVTKKSADANGEEVDITNFFSYGDNPLDPEYCNTIYIPKDKRSGLTLSSGDVITITFMFQKNDFTYENRIAWSGAAFEFKKEVSQDYMVDAWVDGEGAFVREWTDTEVKTLAAGDTARFRVKMPHDKYLNTFSFADSTGAPITLSATNVTRVAVYDRVSHALPVNSALYTFNDDGTITVQDEEIRSKYVKGDPNGCTLVFDIKNTTEAAITYGKVKCTAEAIPEPKELYFGTAFNDDGVGGGYFTYPNTGIQLQSGEYYKAYITLYGDGLTGFRDMVSKKLDDPSQWVSVQFGLSFTDGEGNVIPLAPDATEDLKIKVNRLHFKEKATTINDTSNYSYDDTAKLEGIKSNKEEWQEYCTDILGNIEDFRTLTVQFLYKGTDAITFKEARFTMTATPKK